MHLGDMGTEVYLQEMNATLLENEEYLRGEVLAAMDRIDDGTYGTCENCGKKIIEERLELLPYARHCTPCARNSSPARTSTSTRAGRAMPPRCYNPYNERAAAEIKGTDYTSQDIAVDGSRSVGAGRRSMRDIHAAGTAGGGTAEGGLAGTNIGEGDPDNADLEDAMGSGTHDVAIEADDEDTVRLLRPRRRRGRRHAGRQAGRRRQERRRGIVPSEDPDLPESG